MKVVEGQMALWEMASNMSKADHSTAAQMLREFVDIQKKAQASGPDVLPSTIDVHTAVDDKTGKVVDEIG